MRGYSFKSTALGIHFCETNVKLIFDFITRRTCAGTRPSFNAYNDTGGKCALCNNGTTAHMNFDDEKNTTGWQISLEGLERSKGVYLTMTA